MCQFFSAIATRDGRLLFTEDNSHETIIKRAKFQDQSLHLRSWVRVEYRLSDPFVTVDETSVPAWYQADVALWADRILALRNRIAPFWQTYDTVMTTLLEAYTKATASALQAYNTEMAPARQAYDGTMASTWGAYTKATASAWKIYKNATASARQAYDEARVSALRKYTESLQSMEGYLHV